MSFIQPNVTVGGTTATLTKICDETADLKLANHHFREGDACLCTFTIKLIGRRVPITLKAEICSLQTDSFQIKFHAPTPNWRRTIGFMNKRGAIASTAC